VETLPDTWVQSLRAEYFADGDLLTYMIIDGASVAALIDHLYDDEPDFSCLLKGMLEPDMQEVAPYIVQLRDGEPFTEWVLASALGRHWGIVLCTSLDLRTLDRRYRKLLRVRGPDGEPLFFRFYDPRVLRTFLPTCEEDDLDIWFDGVRHYYAEAPEEGALLRFTSNGQGVQCEHLPLPAPSS
jgi:hypothetical protein